jgi:hypothetical protein
MTMLCFLLIFQIFAFALVNAFYHWQISDTGLFILSTLFELIAFTGSVVLARRFLDKRTFASLGFGLDPIFNHYKDFVYGILIACIIMTFVFVVMGRLGWIQFVGFAWQFDPISVIENQTLLYYLIFFVVGFQEELLCRGYHLQTIASGSNVIWGMLGSSLIFAVMHLGNPGANWMTVLGIFFAGLLLAFAYVRTGRLWLSIGLHIGWNFFEGVVFGFPTSGVTIYALTRIHVTGPTLWTGGAFGPEAGLIILPALLVGAGLVWTFTK